MGIQKRKSPLEAAFLKRVRINDITDCWEWTGTIFQRGGYGSFTHRQSGIINQRAHRVSWKLYRGKLTRKDILRHTCDNRLCVNSEHLLKGTQADNIADMVRKGRTARGEAHSQAKLNEEEVMLIYHDNRLQALIAADYEISVPTVSDIKRGHSWSHVTGHIQAVRL